MAIHRNCEGLRRRDCLSLGLGALLGGGFVSALQSRARGGEPGADKKNTGCILIWLDGGPSHIEMFDPKPQAPAEIRGDFQPIETKVPGLFFSENMQRLAAINDKFTIVRSVCHNQNNHGAGNHYMMTGAPTRIPVSCGAFVSFHPSMGSVVSAERGAPHNLPPYFALPSITRSGGPNFLGNKHAPFVVADDPNNKGFRVRDVTLPAELDDCRSISRRLARKKLDQLQRYTDRAAGDPVVGSDENFQQAVSLMTSEVALKAFEVDREPDSIRERYGRNPLGQRLLLARRLVEAGVKFVNVYFSSNIGGQSTTTGGWDTHGFNNTRQYPILDAWHLPLTDHTLPVFLNDLDERGLLDSTLVVWMGEFGRTPVSQGANGRDHSRRGFSLWLAGGGIRRGYAHGRTDDFGYEAVENIVSLHDLHATLLHCLGLDHRRLSFEHNGRNETLTDADLNHARIVPELLA